MAKKRRLKKNIRTKSLEPAHNTRVRKELLDADYLHTLDPDSYAYKFYAQFTDEWVGGAVSKDDNGKVKPGHIHNTEALAKDVYKRNNDRNNDVLSVARANYLATDVVSELEKNDGWYITNDELTEDALIAQMEEKNSDEAILSKKEFLKMKKKIETGEATMTPEMFLFYLEHYDIELD